MSPPFRKIHNYEEIIKLKAKQSAVLILLYKKEKKPYLVLIERSSYKGVHSKQISFPGGKKEDQDINLKNTAKREAYEEIGIEIDKINIISELSYLYIPISNFIVFPFVATYTGNPTFIKDDKEVKKILEISIEDLLDKKNTISKTSRDFRSFSKD